MIFLSEPSAEYKDGFLTGLQEFQKEGRMLQYNSEYISKNFEEFIQKLQRKRSSHQYSANIIPFSDFWLIDNNEFIGRLSLHHELNEILLRIGGHIGYLIRPSKRRQGYGKEQLRLGLQKARALGLTRVLITCDENNIGSQKIIEYNGGKLENIIEVDGSPVRKMRYWITL